MDIFLLIAFVTTTLLFVAVPGPSVAFVSAQAVRYGPKAATVAVAGDALGTVVHITVAAWGLTTLISISETVLPFLQIVGGLFIIYMGIQAFGAARSSGDYSAVANHKTSFWAGFFACVTNPKAIVFFVALFPGFVTPEHNILLQSLVYGIIFLVLDALSIFGYALLAMYAAQRVSARWLNAEVFSGLGLLGVGLGMVVKGVREIPSD